jgi:hypothetical protein
MGPESASERAADPAVEVEEAVEADPAPEVAEKGVDRSP